ncbi:MAG TPA: GIY-YIG nuclease family protein [Candidatus Rubrimentiphilum sp.]|nr:GIY-YIG nuclease family protein [Candidatus Rubrimentiphilum sp.]
MFVYILACEDGSLYTGWTDDLERRVDLHQKGRGSKYTRSRLPVRLLAWMQADDSSQAKSVEARFKQLSRDEKLTALDAGKAFGLEVHKAS